MATAKKTTPNSTADVAAQMITASKAAEKDKKLFFDMKNINYDNDVKWLEDNVMPGLITWVHTIDPALFLSFMSLWKMSACGNTTQDPVIQTYLGASNEKTIMSMSTFLDVCRGEEAQAEMGLLKTTPGTSNPQVVTNFRNIIDEQIMSQFTDSRSSNSSKQTRVYVFQTRALDETLKYFITDLQEVYTKYWGIVDSSKFKLLPPGFPKIIFLPTISDLMFPSYLKRKAMFVNFDNWVAKSAFCKEFKRVSLLSSSSEARSKTVAFPMTLLEQTITFSGSSQDNAILAKNSLINSQPGLTAIENPPDPDMIAGYEKVKQWAKRAKTFMESEHYKESERPRGILLVGFPGTGKTTMARALSAILGWQLIEMDIAQMKGGIQGQTEQNMLSATSTLVTIGKAVLLLDEIEKALGGVVSSNATDGGTTMGIMNRLLQFMESDDHSVITVMTANSVHDIPPPLMRSGRIDLCVYAELPKATTREQIFNIHLTNTAIPVKLESEHLKEICKITADFSGAEIESAVYHTKWDLVEAKKFDKLTSDLLYKTLVKSIKEIKPVAKSRSEDLDKIRQWAEAYALSTEE